jgi:OOP family OmpA-OmpF porin
MAAKLARGNSMSIDLLDSLSSILGSPITRQLSTFFGDSEENTRSGLRSSFSTLLAAVMHKSTLPGGASELFRTVTSSNVDGALSTRLPSLLDNHGSLQSTLQNGESMLSSIFGSRAGGVTHAVSEVAGIKPATATGLLAMAAPLLLGAVKKLVTQGGLDAGGLSSLLFRQSDSLQKAGLDSRITSAMGFSSLQSMLEPVAASARATGSEARMQSASGPASYAVPVRRKRERSWLPWVVAVAALVVVLGILTSRLGGRSVTQTASTTATTGIPATVYFAVGQSDLDEDGRRAVVAAANSVKTSDVPIAVTGYADPSGNPDQNLGLAKNRAAAVRDALVQEGVPESRVMMTPPDEARRVEITLAEAGTATQR